jgi:hypothetical protein
MRWWLAYLFIVTVEAQTPEQSLLDKVKAGVEDNLKRLPDYTCTENIERSLRSSRGKRLRSTDRVRLNVAYVGGKELFGLPGAGRIEHAKIDQLVGGSIGNGQFAVFVRSIFFENRATLGHPSRTKLDGTPAFRFDYSVPLALSGYLVQSSLGKAIVGYSGRFWVARDSLHLMRLVVSADQLPPSLEIVSVVTTTDYGRISIGRSEFLLPQRSTYKAKDALGGQAWNVTTFENCREFVGESVLKFGDP